MQIIRFDHSDGCAKCIIEPDSNSFSFSLIGKINFLPYSATKDYQMILLSISETIRRLSKWISGMKCNRLPVLFWMTDQPKIKLVIFSLIVSDNFSKLNSQGNTIGMRPEFKSPFLVV